jgi:hypothetical protein
MAAKGNIKSKALTVSVELEIIKKVDAQPHETRTKVVEQLCTPVSMLNNITAKKKKNHTSAMCNSSARQKKV